MNKGPEASKQMEVGKGQEISGGEVEVILSASRLGKVVPLCGVFPALFLQPFFSFCPDPFLSHLLQEFYTSIYPALRSWLLQLHTTEPVSHTQELCVGSRSLFSLTSLLWGLGSEPLGVGAVSSSLGRSLLTPQGRVETIWASGSQTQKPPVSGAGWLATVCQPGCPPCLSLPSLL